MPIGHSQTISQPYIVALMTELLRARPGMRVLEIGTGSGYQAAVLAEIVDTVYTIEFVRDLAEKARERLGELGYTNIVVRGGDGYNGWPEHAPFDAIIVTAAVNHIPGPLLDQLAEGGRIGPPAGRAVRGSEPHPGQEDAREQDRGGRSPRPVRSAHNNSHAAVKVDSASGLVAGAVIYSPGTSNELTYYFVDSNGYGAGTPLVVSGATGVGSGIDADMNIPYLQDRIEIYCGLFAAGIEIKMYGIMMYQFDTIPSDMKVALEWMRREWSSGNKSIYPGWKGL